MGTMCEETKEWMQKLEIMNKKQCQQTIDGCVCVCVLDPWFFKDLKSARQK